jgi:hypothetical protein
LWLWVLLGTHVVFMFNFVILTAFSSTLATLLHAAFTFIDPADTTTLTETAPDMKDIFLLFVALYVLCLVSLALVCTGLLSRTGQARTGQAFCAWSPSHWPQLWVPLPQPRYPCLNRGTLPQLGVPGLNSGHACLNSLASSLAKARVFLAEDGSPSNTLSVLQLDVVQ